MTQLKLRSCSSIQPNYSKKYVFLLIFTGFIGKVVRVLERLLHHQDLQNVEKVFVLIRSNKTETYDRRFKTLSDSPCFKSYRKAFIVNEEEEEGDGASSMIVAVKGDLT